jgi:hypothetical protein
VKFCGACGGRVGEDATAERRDAEPDPGERRQLTVLFCDLVGYERAATLGASAGDAARLGVARTGLAIFYYTRGEIERGRALAAEVLAAAEARGDPEQTLLGHTNLVVPEFYQGKCASSLAHC